MNRILGIFAVSSALLTACGGGIQSPDFKSTLKGIFISSVAESTPVTGTLNVAPSGSLQLKAQGLYSTPPGTKSGTSGTTNCPAPDTTLVCTLGPVTGVTFTIDPPAANNRTVASIDSAGLVTGVRRGQTTVRARLAGFTEASRGVRVDGPVLKGITVAARDIKNNADLPRPGETVASVPTGRSIQLIATALCDSNSADTGNPSSGKCTTQNYGFNWALPLGTSADTVAFTPSPAVGRIVAAKTQRLGPFSIEVQLNNEEGDPIDGAINLEATTRVLDDVLVVAENGQSEPVALVKGTKVSFVAKGVFSDGSTGDLIEADLSDKRPDSATGYRGGKRLTWRQDNSFVGGPIFIEDPADADGDGVIDSGETGNFNNKVIVTVKETSSQPAVIGPNGLTALGFNTEKTTLLVDDRAAIDVRDLGLTALTRICLATDLASVCSTNTQVQQDGDPVKYVARGTFQGDAAGTERNIDPSVIPVEFRASTATQALIDVNVDADRDGKTGNAPDNDFDDVGAVRGKAQGLARLIATLPSSFATTISQREAQIDIAVTEKTCRDQFLLSNGTVGSNDTVDTIGISDSTNAGNVIDSNPTSYGTLTMGPSVLGGSVLMTFQRAATPVLVGGGAQNVGFIVNDQLGYVSSSTATVRTLDAAGAVVETFTSGLTIGSNNATGDAQRSTIVARATKPFTGTELVVDVPLLLGIPGTLTDLPELTLLTGYEVRVYSACANTVVTTP